MKHLLLIAASVLIFAKAHGQSTLSQQKFVNYTEFGGLFGRVASGPETAQLVENKLSFTAQTFNGVQVSRQVAVGGIVGVDWYKAALLMPVGAGVRLDLIPHPSDNMRLLAIADLGYGLTWLHKSSTGYEINGGWMLNPGLALRIGKPGSTAFCNVINVQKTDCRRPKAYFGE